MVPEVADEVHEAVPCIRLCFSRQVHSDREPSSQTCSALRCSGGAAGHEQEGSSLPEARIGVHLHARHRRRLTHGRTDSTAGRTARSCLARR
jgi:hypothetical protein